jgi:hypothetical protein
MGDWFRVATMPGMCARAECAMLAATFSRLDVVVPSHLSSGVSDVKLKEANDNIGRYYFDRHMWVKASDYFQKIQKWDMVAKCLIRLEQWQELRLLVDTKVADTSRELLCEIGECCCCCRLFGSSLIPTRRCIQEHRPC